MCGKENFNFRKTLEVFFFFNSRSDFFSNIIMKIFKKIANFRYDTGVVSGAMLLIEKDDRIKPDTLWKELIVASTVGTAGIFALVGGFFNEYFGRKPTILTARYVHMYTNNHKTKKCEIFLPAVVVKTIF